ncbi:hypothetical protein [Massilia mucilaginosa]|uniref:hypothetical protein n=1 Tax=Massilia mucilaginosa TaxID=2609282 RepID=UPI001E626817|nr:hypothetical protein [Massilia mucilaginosa]
MVVWRVFSRVPFSGHGVKYRLLYGIDGRRLVEDDNEREKVDHRHVKGREEPVPRLGRSLTISLLMWLGQGTSHERYRPACELRPDRIESVRP